jgi:hypothetical protein
MIYVASPYSHSNPATQQQRFEDVRAIVALYLPRTQQPVFSPIVYTHELASEYDMATDAASWTRFNNGMLRIASQLWVVRIKGWDTSKGVTQEIELARQLSIPTYYLDVNGVFVP